MKLLIILIVVWIIRIRTSLTIWGSTYSHCRPCDSTLPLNSDDKPKPIHASQPPWTQFLFQGLAYNPVKANEIFLGLLGKVS